MPAAQAGEGLCSAHQLHRGWLAFDLRLDALVSGFFDLAKFEQRSQQQTFYNSPREWPRSLTTMPPLTVLA
jgi:hypothetical protein